jgi:two-component system chemotaxis response regulator CheB
MEEKTERERLVALTCPTCGGAVAQTTEGDLPSFTCHLGHSFAADEMGEAQFHKTRRVLETALRMFKERVELARRLAEAQQRRGRPVSAAHWEATSREMDEAAEVLRRLLTQGGPRPNPRSHDGAEPGPA